MSFKVTKNYNTVHAWIRRKYGKANMCESSTCSGKSKRFSYAKIKGKRYSRKRGNYKMLCYSCHVKYDRDENTIKRMKRNSFNHQKKYCPNGHKYDGKNLYRYGKEKQYRNCRICMRNNVNKYAYKNRIKFRLYRKNNREAINARWRKYYHKNKFNKSKTYAKK